MCERLPTTRIGTAGGATRISDCAAPRWRRECADAGCTPVQESLGGRGHHPQHRLVLDDEGDIDREFAVAFDELAGAIERVDHP